LEVGLVRGALADLSRAILADVWLAECVVTGRMTCFNVGQRRLLKSE
jgi:hypothetical protein